MEFIRRFCLFDKIIRLKRLNIIRYLFVISFVFYFGLYLSWNIVPRKCPCVNQTNKVNSNTHLKERPVLVGTPNARSKSLTTFLLVIVLTGPNNIEHRNAMRSTWLNVTTHLNSSVRRFVIGTGGLNGQTKESLEQEQHLNGDMLLLEDFEDGYNQLTQKLLRALLWISNNVLCSFVMKVDDDSFARLDIIVSELRAKYLAVDNLYWGFHRGNARVKYVGQWAEKKWLLCDHYLPYALGGGYIISMKLVHYVANISSLVVLYNSEDVSLGTWLSPLNLIRIHDPRFDTEWMSRGCRNVHIVSHKQSVKDMFDKFIELRDHNKLCKQEEYLRKSFIYFWAVPPSQCCIRKEGIP